MNDPTITPAARLRGLLQLTRWAEHLLFTFTLTLLGINLAIRAEGAALALDHRLVVVALANLLAVTFAFMINDTEDAPDDARDAARAARNPVASGVLTRREAWMASLVTAALAVTLFSVLPLRAFLAGLLTLGLAFLYSWRPVRLKAHPLVDVIAHVLMLSALLFLTGYFTYHDVPGRAWLVALIVALVSAYGQLYNQVRDFAPDRAAGLHNTAALLGEHAARRAMYLCLWGAGLLLAVTILIGLWPWWLAIVPVALSPLLVVIRPHADMRGTAAVDLSGRLQWGAMLIAGVTMLVWLAANLAR